jgi:hypothetical protein
VPNAKPETRFYRRVDSRLPPMSKFHRQKIGTGTTNGTADFWYSGSRADLWVEYKWANRVQGDIDVYSLLSALQRHWLASRAAEGRNVAVIVGTPQGNQIFVGETWKQSFPIGAFTLTDAQVAQYLAGFCLNDYSEVLSKGCNGHKPDL